MAIQILGRPSAAPDSAIPDVGRQSITPQYLSTLAIPLLRGRNFDNRDRGSSAPVALVNQALAEEYFPAEDPVGSRIRFDEQSPWTTIVGVIGTEKRITVYQEMSWADVAVVYRPLAQAAPPSAVIAVRVASDSVPVEAALRHAVAAVDSQVAVEAVRPLTADFTRFLAYPGFRAAVLSGFAIFGLLLSAIGLEGVLAQMVVQKRQEVGVRMALGARPAHIIRLIAIEGGVPVAAGLGTGLVLADWLGHLLGSLLYQTRPGNPAMAAAISLTLLLTASGAILIPARRAARVDPMVELRNS
jgi:putative ABC transport system permease protein